MKTSFAAIGLAAMLASGGASAEDQDAGWQAVCASLPAADPCHLVIKYNAALAASNADIPARRAGETSLCAGGKMTRDGCQPR